MYDKHTGEWSNPSVKKVAQQRDYYPPETELRLARLIEAPGHSALDILRDGGVLSSQQRIDFGNYLAVMMMRGPRKRRIGYETAPRVTTATFAEVRSDVAKLRSEENATVVESSLAEIDLLEEQYQENLPEFARRQIESPWPSAGVARLIHHMTWRILNIPSRLFLMTTDTPVFYFSSIGLGKSQSEFTFAVCPDRAIIGSHQGRPGTTYYHTAEPKIAKLANRRIASFAERFVFTPRPAEWVETLANRNDPRLSGIRWE